MLGRGRMRRGVSLEVIVEEDDNAEVTHDPLPPLYDDEDDDEDDDDDSENGRSSRNNPGGGGDGRGGRGEGGGGEEGGGRAGRGGISIAEERRRRRERRKTMGLLRLRSVSCETLTLLDTSDMDSCCSEWDDDDDLSTSSANYVTINRPISRRRILESNQCDSEDSGIEYQSDTPPEDQSGGEDHRQDDNLTDDIHDQETATESDDDDETATATDSDARTDVEEDAGSPNDAAAIGPEAVEEVTDLKAAEEEVEEISEVEMVEKEEEEEEEVEEVVVVEEEEESGSSMSEMSAREVLENDKVVVVEKTPSVPLKTTPSQGEAEEEELRRKRAAYTIRNKEVQLEELPAPHTVRSVRQLFEDRRTPLGHLRAWRDLGRFRDIKSNPSSKILRFDRSDSGDGQSSTRFPRLGRSFTLPRRPTHSTHDATPSTTLPRPHKAPSLPLARPTEPQDTAKPSAQVATTQEGQVITLRKPTVRGFNVKKALQEDPRTFHARKSHGARGRTHRPSDSTTDRSDTESLASDISEDSGLSNDSSTTSSTTTPNTAATTTYTATTTTTSTTSTTTTTTRSLRNLTSDPSFKWIDPTIMAKIRAVGTTVIFFGPRQKSQSRSCSGLLTRPLPKHLMKATPPAAPRIVGVVRKKAPPPRFPGSGEGGAAPPGKWRKAPDTSVVYDFTRHQAAPWV